ncbi:MAG: hypothetical protein OXQ89_18150 [Rhodospirillaceae bacterium]|nr:hypothetical protein [Rhodospirillaceae bacterium]
MTRIEFWSAVMGLLVAIVVMFNQVSGRLDTMQAENNRRFDQLFEVLRVFERRITRLEERTGIEAE